MSLETADDPCVKWLDERGHIWCEELQFDVGWTVFDIVTTEIVNSMQLCCRDEILLIK